MVPPTGTNTGTLKRGTTYALRVNGQYGNTDLAVWVDWDHDSTFEANNEFIQITGGSPL